MICARPRRRDARCRAVDRRAAFLAPRAQYFRAGRRYLEQMRRETATGSGVRVETRTRRAGKAAELHVCVRPLAPAAAERQAEAAMAAVAGWGCRRRLHRFVRQAHPHERPRYPHQRTASVAGQTGRQVQHHPEPDARHQRPRNGRLHGADRPSAGRTAELSLCGRGRQPVPGPRGRLSGADSAVRGADAAPGPLLRGRIPWVGVQAFRHGRRPGGRPVRRRRHRTCSRDGPGRGLRRKSRRVDWAVPSIPSSVWPAAPDISTTSKSAPRTRFRSSRPWRRLSGVTETNPSPPLSATNIPWVCRPLRIARAWDE